jgi:hypothetical protein
MAEVSWTPKRTDTIDGWTVVAARPHPYLDASRQAIVGTVESLGREVTYVSNPHGTSTTYTVTALPPFPGGISEWDRENYGAEAQTWMVGVDPDHATEHVAWELLLRR